MAYVFKSADGSQTFKGHMFLGPTSCAECASCKSGARELKLGLGVTFQDEAGKVLFVTGTSCFSKHTNIELRDIPRLGLSDSDLKALGLGKRRRGGAREPFEKAITILDPEQEEAYANVLLRAQKMPLLGFDIGQSGLEKYLELRPPYNTVTLRAIQRYVENGERYHGKPSLDQLNRAFYVACQIDALSPKLLSFSDKQKLSSLNADLLKWCGLTDKQME
ncbi:MAG: hypothetical protein C0508_28175, partial [Cyanobacteria bacterium PR.023]|nr:hypothetical protein [Cyanobacteria bacterium PR.023]